MQRRGEQRGAAGREGRSMRASVSLYEQAGCGHAMYDAVCQMRLMNLSEPAAMQSQAVVYDQSVGVRR